MRLGIRTIKTIAACSAAFTTLFVTQVASAAGGFGQFEVDQSRFIAVAAPVGSSNERQLLILEQVSNDRPCWSEAGSNPTVVDPLMLSFDFTGICGRSTDANGYSMRMNGQDLALQYRFEIVERDNDLILVGSLNDPTNRDAPDVEVGRAYGVSDGFVRINLNPGWRFTKRTLDDRVLGHVYLTYEGTVPENVVLPPRLDYTFGDIAFDVYGPEIQQAVNTGFVSGFEDNTFRPQETLTREQLVSMVLEALSRIASLNIVLPTAATGNPYARDNNIVRGYQDGTFRPTQPVTRAEMMAVLRRAAEYSKAQQGVALELSPSQPPIAFSDLSGHWAEPLINQMSGYCGIATPVNDRGTAFAPDSPALRNYAAAATLRMFNCAATTPTARAR
jgi:N-acetylmuramoyl-L-alanine amidase